VGARAPGAGRVLHSFDAVATGDEVRAHKPDPAVYLLALDRLRVQGSRAIAVEDTPHGVAAARASGMRTVAIPNPFVDDRELAAADLTLPSAAELPLREALERATRGNPAGHPA
jgi:beta-phosphoglucomutase-like phosphatase (HAD superfamily)